VEGKLKVLWQEIIDRADLVTDMHEIKHPWQQKIPAQRGIDY